MFAFQLYFFQFSSSFLLWAVIEVFFLTEQNSRRITSWGEGETISKEDGMNVICERESTSDNKKGRGRIHWPRNKYHESCHLFLILCLDSLRGGVISLITLHYEKEGRRIRDLVSHKMDKKYAFILFPPLLTNTTTTTCGEIKREEGWRDRSCPFISRTVIIIIAGRHTKSQERRSRDARATTT